MSDLAQLVVPGIPWHPTRGFAPARGAIDHALRLDVGGFLLLGGPAEDVRALTRELRERSRHPLLIAAAVERGAGGCFAGATGLPPLGALGRLGEVEPLRYAARLTAREAQTLGVNWALAPVCDVDVVPDNPVDGARMLGKDPTAVAELAAEWVDACQAEGVLACAKHFPGLGRAAADPEREPATIGTRREPLIAELAPFRAALDAGVASVMTSHAAYPALDPRGAPATLSRPIIEGLLRGELGFDGLIASDALVKESVLVGRGENEAAVGALDAGCDLLLHAGNPAAVVRALDDALRGGRLDRERVRRSLERRQRWAEWGRAADETGAPAGVPTDDDVRWANALAERVVHSSRGAVHPLRTVVEVVLVDDEQHVRGDAPERDAFADALVAAGVTARVVDAPTGESHGTVIVALFGEPMSSKRRMGYSARSRSAVAAACAAADRQARDAVVVQFGSPRLAAEIPTGPALVCAWDGDLTMQRAAARWLAGRRA
jgi:beta-glucosidase-like glycosyl hydrolase